MQARFSARNAPSKHGAKQPFDPGAVLEGAFVDDEGPPAERRQGREVVRVARTISREFLAALATLVARFARAARAVVAVPETAVNENRQQARAIDDIRLARQPPAIEPVAGREGVRNSPHGALGGGAVRFDRAHDGGTVHRDARFILSAFDFHGRGPSYKY